MFGISEKSFQKYINESMQNIDKVEKIKTEMPLDRIMLKVAVNYYLKEFLNNTTKLLESCDKNQAKNVLIFARKMWQKAEQLLEADSKSQDIQHENTGINVLEELLKKIIPIVEKDYKMLTSDPAQRQSYRAHMINAIQNLISGQNLTLGAATQSKGFADRLMESFIVEQEVMEELPPVEDETATTDQDKEKFIDVFNLRKGRADMAPKEDKEDIEYSIFSLEGNDETGRNISFKTFKKIQPQITDFYNILANESDQQLFSDYLLANMKLYFDKFEEEITAVLPEPTNSEYEAASMNGINAAHEENQQSQDPMEQSPETSELPPIE